MLFFALEFCSKIHIQGYIPLRVYDSMGLFQTILAILVILITQVCHPPEGDTMDLGPHSPPVRSSLSRITELDKCHCPDNKGGENQ